MVPMTTAPVSAPPSASSMASPSASSSVSVPPTADRILAVALDRFGTRGYEATSLDAIAAALGMRKQSVLYWFPSKAALLDAVIARGATELTSALEAAINSAPVGLDRLDAVMRAVFRFAVRQPGLLGLVRELSRVGPTAAADLATRIEPLLDRAAIFMADEMDAGRVRRADPRSLLLFAYTTVVGVATETEARRVLGIEGTVAGLARLRRELFAFVRAALTPVSPNALSR
jgi:TetR/AcrR family transcriptional regulator